MRPQILKEDPKTQFDKVGIIMGERWRLLTTEQKKKYADLADVDKIRYEREMEIFLKVKEEKEAADKVKQERYDLEMQAKQERHDLEVQDFAAHAAGQQEMRFVQNSNQHLMPMPMPLPMTMQIAQIPPAHYTTFDPNISNMIYYDPNNPYQFS